LPNFEALFMYLMRQQIFSEKSVTQNSSGAESFVNDIANLYTATPQLTTKWIYDQMFVFIFLGIWQTYLSVMYLTNILLSFLCFIEETWLSLSLSFE
jgi:hypothetical protein